jgi:hypothetical protein
MKNGISINDVKKNDIRKNNSRHIVSLTLVTFFFETSKPQANIYYALVGLECQA